MEEIHVIDNDDPGETTASTMSDSGSRNAQPLEKTGVPVVNKLLFDNYLEESESSDCDA